MKREQLAGMWIVLLLLAVLLMFVGSAATLAQEPTPPEPEEPAPAEAPQPRIPRHRPGYLAKVDNLDVLVAQGRIPDPLFGNTTLVAWDRIALVWEDEDGTYSRKTYAVDKEDAMGNPVHKHKQTSDAQLVGARNIDIAAGYLSEPEGWIDTVAAFENPDGYIHIHTQTYDKDLDMDRVGVTIVAEDQVQGGATAGFDPAVPYGALIRVATGDFDGDGFDEFVVAWEGPDESLKLRVFDTEGGIQPLARGTNTITDTRTLGGWKWLDVTTGDFDGNGDAEIAVAWQRSDQSLGLQVYDVTTDGQLTAEAELAYDVTTDGQLTAEAELTEENARPGRIAITTGDFDGNRWDEIAVAFNSQNEATLSVYRVEDNLHTLTRARSPFSTLSGEGLEGDEVRRVIGVGAGDFGSVDKIADGIDEIVLVYAATKGRQCIVRVFEVTEDLFLRPGPSLPPAWLTSYGELSLAVGDMNRDLLSEILIVSRPGAFYTDPRLQMGLFKVESDLSAIEQRGYLGGVEAVADHGDGTYGHLAVAVGGFDGKNVRVGPPTHQTLAKTKQIIAVINAPPKHRDVVDGETFDVNVTDTCEPPVGPPCTYAKYETEQKTSTTMGLTTTRDWGVSTEVQAKAPYVKASLKTSYGEKFEKTTTSFKTTEFGQDVEANHDDAIVRIEQDLDVWEYPVYLDASGVVSGYIQVTWPVKADPACSSNCSAAITAVIDGKNPLSYYQPNHEYGNVLSYSIEPPTDISTTVKADTLRYLGINPYQMWVKWSDVEEEETKKSSEMDIEQSLKVSGFGQKIEQKGEYSQGENSVNKVSFEESTSIHLYFWEIEPEYSYAVRPIFYWAKPDGRLVLDYAVTPLTATPPTWWQSTYDKADPAFNLPWKDHPPAEDYRLLTKEITFSPASPNVGEEVAIAAKVRNYSQVGVNNVPVRFYAGDPDDGGTQIGETTLATINPMSSTPASVKFDTSGHSGQTVDIYAVIDPNNTLQEMHKDNNKAYAKLPVKPLADPAPPATLSITADNIAFNPGTPAAGEVVQILATVHASGDTFTHVAVEFWDGDPVRGGRLIDGRVIPMILDGQTGTADIGWDTAGLRGRRDIWVVIHRHPDEHALHDNRAHKALSLEPHWLYFPLVGKD